VQSNGKTIVDFLTTITCRGAQEVGFVLITYDRRHFLLNPVPLRTFHPTSIANIMAGGAAKYRHLSRSSSHRQALLRNLVTSLIKHESITTTWAKAKEAQRLAEKVITLGKKNTEASKRRALEIFYVCV
jgi:hypothetical protein